MLCWPSLCLWRMRNVRNNTYMRLATIGRDVVGTGPGDLSSPPVVVHAGIGFSFALSLAALRLRVPLPLPLFWPDLYAAWMAVALRLPFVMLKLM